MKSLCAIRDLIFQILPNCLIKLLMGKTDFCFMVHPRDLVDVYNHFPLWGLLSQKMVKQMLRWMWPLIGPKITGLKTKNGRELVGRVVFCPLLPEQLLLRRKNGVKNKVVKTAKVADKLGAKIIGLGGFTAAASRYGKDLVGNIKAVITTGHSYTAYAVIEIACMSAQIVGLNLNNATVAIVGAAGSVGSACVELIDEKKLKKLLLVETPRMLKSLQELFRKTNNETFFTSELADIKEADLVVTLTNATTDIIKKKYLKLGAIVVDDSQPANISRDIVEENNDILISGCAIHAPKIHCSYDFGLPKEAIFTCLGEVLALCCSEYLNNGLPTVGRVNIQHAKKIGELVAHLNFHPLIIDNQGRSITYQKLWEVCEIRYANRGENRRRLMTAA